MSTKREIFIQAYLDAALWAERELKATHQRWDVELLADGTRIALERMASKFFEAHSEDFKKEDTVQAATDLWLTQNGYGAGFWGGNWPEPWAGRMETTARGLGEVELYVGDDGKIYAMGHEEEAVSDTRKSQDGLIAGAYAHLDKELEKK